MESLRDRVNGNGRFRLWTQVLMWAAATIVTVTLAYGAVNTRVAVLEAKFEAWDRQLREIRADVKELLRR